MNPEEFRRVKEIFVEALRHEPAERGAFLVEASGGDEWLQAEVEAWIGEDERANALPSVPQELRLEVGQLIDSRVGRYRLDSELGRGSMGIVYRATDCRLGRPVAIKFLRPSLAHAGETFARFEQEARLLARLTHPNIVTIYAVGETGGLHFLVLELVEGESLLRLLRRRALDVEEALSICRQLADAIAAGHARGVIHRDIKPGNVIITPDGIVKVHDFGLAKTTFGVSDQEGTAQPTAPQTQHGILMGSPGYMSREQICGQPQDERTDIFAFGCVLFECLSGRLPFPGETVHACLHATLSAEPDWSTLPVSVPPRLRRLLARVLAKAPESRLANMGQARQELDIVREEIRRGKRTSLPRPNARVTGAAAACIAVFCLGAWWLSEERANVRDAKAFDQWQWHLQLTSDEYEAKVFHVPGELDAGRHVLAISLRNRAVGSEDLRIAEISLGGLCRPVSEAPTDRPRPK